MDRSRRPVVLMVAYHFPPLRGSSGIQRTLRFCRYLPEFGWQPMVLTAHPRAYDDVAEDLLADIPAGLLVRRAFALNTARHLALGGRYPALLAIPDRWVSWIFGGVIAGLSMIRRYRIRAIYSTYPIATAHVIGLVLHRLTGLPWIADFRDPMAQDGYPEDPRVWKSFRWIEERALRRAQKSLFTSPGAIRDYQARYPDIPAERYALIENGYDEEAFAGVTRRSDSTAAASDRAEYAAKQETKCRHGSRCVILHSGIVYASERDPTHLFRALGMLKKRGLIDAQRVELRFRASANDDLLHSLSQEHDIADLLSIAPAIPYSAALSEMIEVDALLIMQAANCNSQIPAKVYEYLRAGRPILALTDPAGDTADLMRRAGIEWVVPLDSTDLIACALPAFIDTVRSGTAQVPRREFVLRCSRRERTRLLAAVLDDLV